MNKAPLKGSHMLPFTPPPTALGESSLPPVDPAGRSVMLIDDSRAVRVVIEASFRRAGLSVAAFPDGLSAIHALTNGDTTVPEVLLLDIGLPKMDGYEIARILRMNEAFKDTIIIMLTGRGGVIDRFRSKLVGASAFIEKPFRVSHVVNVVRGYLGLPHADPSTDQERRPRS
jgi:twitching motility two-component system response regulator PilG